MDNLELFLSTTITTESGWLQLLLTPEGREEFYRWPEQKEQVLERIRSREGGNIYFSPHLFSKPESFKSNALPSRTLVVDLDNADVSDLFLNPTFLVETSEGRHQGFWILKEEVSIEDFEILSKKLTYTIPNADHSGWPIGHKFRIPGTKNFKYDPAPTVQMVVSLSSEREFALSEIKQWVQDTDVSFADSGNADDAWINNPPTEFPQDAREVIEKYRSKLSPKVFALFDEQSVPRYEALWALMNGLFRAGATRDEVFWICKFSANNKFAQDQHYNADRDLAKDVDRADKAHKSNQADISQLVQTAERAPGTANDRRRLVSKIVLTDMLRKGEFVYTDDGRYWYLHANAGRPIAVSRHSEQLDSLLDMVYGLNGSDGFQPYVVTHLSNYTIARGKRARSGVMSFYTGNELLLHSGKADVYRITPESVTRHHDGSFGVLFPWRAPLEEMITLDELDPLPDDWAEWLFDGWFDNLLDFEPREAKVILRVWTLFLLFRDSAVSRPILTLLGQPGSGKSTLFRLLYVLFYGQHKSLSAVSTPDDFDFLVSSDPLVVFDNVDTWANWLPDRLALSASSSDLVKRKLYTDTDTITLKRQAILGITAHDPHFGRADVVDRMIILNLQRRDSFTPEGMLMERTHRARGRLWYAIVRDAQRVLATPDPKLEEIPEFRISDFARVGTRIAQALGIYPEFVAVINKLRATQVAFSLSSEDTLIDVIRRWLVLRKGPNTDFLTVGYLHEQFKMIDSSYEKVYKTSSVLSRKLWTMQTNLRSVFDVDYMYDGTRGIRSWKFQLKEGLTDGTTSQTAHL